MFAIRSTRQMALLAGGTCALILAAVLLLNYYLVRPAGDRLLWASLFLAILPVSAVVGAACALWSTRLIRPLALRVRELIAEQGEPSPLPRHPRALIEYLYNALDRIAGHLEASQRHNRELEALAAINSDLNQARSLAEMGDLALTHAAAVAPYRRGYVALVDRDDGELRVIAGRGIEEGSTVTCDMRRRVSAQSITLPLRSTDADLGLLHLESPKAGQDEIHLLELLVEILSTAVEKRRLFESAWREARAQKLLNEAGRVLTSTLDKQEVLTRVMQEVTHTLNAEAGSILLVDEERGDMYFAASASPSAELLRDTRVPLGHGIVGWAVTHREAVLVRDARNDPRFYNQVDRQTGMRTRSLICVPLLSKDKVIGAIEVMNPRSGNFTTHDLHLLESLAPQAAVAIENAMLYESLKSQMDKLKRTQNKLIQAEKLSAIGQLVAGVAHELNNPLTAIIGYSQLLLDAFPEGPMREDLERINREAQRSARIVRNLLAFARQQRMEKLPVDLADVLNRTLDLVAYHLEVNDILLVRDIADEPMVVLGDVNQLQQVFLNLINNAHQAMYKAHGGGTLTIYAAPTDKGRVRVQVMDDGPGIPPEVMGRVFDPFFTTKDVGEGTGLGLSICLGIVQEHGGHIWAESEVGKGTVLTVELPLYEGTPMPMNQRESPPTVESTAERSILVVDDEVEIVRILKRILESKGYKVTTATDGQGALAAIERDNFDLVICDLKMPGMDGRDLYEWLRRERPDMTHRVVFSTGDVVSNDSWSFLQKVEGRFIAKPFKPGQILSFVEQKLMESSR